MKVVAHPLVVAVALGLLGPSALEAQDDNDEPVKNGVRSVAVEPGAFEMLPEPSAEAFEAVELEWLKRS